ncbi:MAG TPA: baseplate J/gp47 family protein [bacterium]
MPATEAEAEAELRAQLQARGSRIANQSPFSPFFLLLGVLLSKAWLYVRNLIIGTYLPSIFTSTATGAALDLRGLEQDEVRKPASKALGNITFVRSGTLGDLNIPAGTAVETPPIEGAVYVFHTLALGTIVAGQSTVAIAAEAAAVGAAYNVGDGYLAVLPSSVAGVIQVANLEGWLTAPGRDIESDADFAERLKLKWRRQGLWHVDDTYRSLISDIAGISPGNIFFDHASPRGPGSADAYVITDSGLPSDELVTLADDYVNAEGNHGEGDDLRVKAMPPLPVPINVVITPNADATEGDIALLLSTVEDLIRAAFRQSVAYADVPRVAPFKRVATSGLGGQLHAHFPLLDAVEWTLPADDPEPGLELPVIQKAELDLAAATDEGGGKVGLPATAHGIADGTKVTISGTVNYNGVFTLDAASSADKIVIVHAYVAEVLAGAPLAEALVIEVAA